MRGLLLLVVVAGCSSEPVVYDRMSWAKMSFEEARATCYHEINSVSLGSNMYLCLRAKGWQER